MNQFIRFGAALFFSLIIVGCQLSGSDFQDEVSNEPLPTPQTAKVEEVKSEKNVTEEEKNLRGLYSSLICMMADPNFWDGFWEGENGWVDEEEDLSNTQKLFRSYGFESEEEIEGTMKKHITKQDFRLALSADIKDRCGEHIDDDTIRMVVTNLEKKFVE